MGPFVLPRKTIFAKIDSMKLIREKLKAFGTHCWYGVEMFCELLIYIVIAIFEFWFVSIIVVFIFIIWYLGYLT